MPQKNDAGFILPLAVLAVVAIMALLALGVDLGRAWYYRQSVQSAADAAAIAGATRLSTASSASSASAHAAAIFLAGTGNLPVGWSPTISVSADAAAGQVTLEASGDIRTAFAGIVGMHRIGISVKSTASRTGSGFPYVYELLP